jgi:hypothetical protein
MIKFKVTIPDLVPKSHMRLALDLADKYIDFNLDIIVSHEDMANFADNGQEIPSDWLTKIGPKGVYVVTDGVCSDLETNTYKECNKSKATHKLIPVG